MGCTRRHHNIGKDPSLADIDSSLAALFVNFTDETHPLQDVQGCDVRVATHLGRQGHPSDGDLGPQ